MKSSSFSINKIYGQPSVHTLKNRINFIATRRKKKWLSIENNIQITQPCLRNSNSPNNRDTHDTPPKEEKENAREAITNKVLLQSKAKSMELQDLKTKRYLQRKEDSERILRELEVRRAVELQNKQLKRLRVVRDQQQGREALWAQEEVKLRQSPHVKNGVEAALQVRTVEVQQQLQRQQERQLECYQDELTYRSLVMRRIQQLMQDQHTV